MTTGAQVREAQQKRGLVVMGKSTATGATTYLTDTIRLQRSRLSPQEYGEAQIRIVSGDSNNNGYVGELSRIDPSTGRAYVDPAVSVAFASGAVYEIWKHGIAPDDGDRSRDRALIRKCSFWPLRALSELAQVTGWATGAYAAGTGGVTNAAAAVQTLSFPTQYFAQAMRVTNSGANGLLSSESYYVQPMQTYRVFGWVSVRAQTASVRVRDLTAGADITIGQTSTFTLRGWQRFDLTFTIPASCGQIEVWLGGASASCIADWSGVGLLPTQAYECNLPSDITSIKDVGSVFVLTGDSGIQSADRRNMIEIPCWREKASTLVRLRSNRPLASGGGVYYQFRQFYTALQSAYYAVSDRTTGDAATTDCELAYLEAATTVELLESMPRDEELDKIFLIAMKDLNYWERQLGPDPMVPSAPKEASIAVMRL